MFDNDSDKTWQYFGTTDPYFGVLTHDDFRSHAMDSSAKTQFFESGQRYVDWLMATIRSELDPSFAPARAVDFGCGVARLTLPLSAVCGSVVGVDVSDGMLAEARVNARDSGVSNADFAKADDELSQLQGDFDFLHSLIVFQHIPPQRGEAILKRMLSSLSERGIGALHFTTTWSSDVPLARQLLVNAYRAVPGLYTLRNIVKRRPMREPMMQMNRYNLNHLLRILQEAGCHRVHLRFTQTGYFGHDFYGVILMFQKQALDVRAHA